MASELSQADHVMTIPRIIPCLLLRGNGFVKTCEFKKPIYVGDCFNTVRLFNEKEVDELIILDIQACIERKPRLNDFLGELAGECFMPVGYGGGVCSIEHMRQIFYAGYEKVVVNTQVWRDGMLIPNAVKEFGSQSIIVSLDVRRNFFGRYEVFVEGGRISMGIDPITAAKQVQDMGAGEIFLTSIDRDGTMQGYDLQLTRNVADAVQIPVIANGGASSISDFQAAVNEGHASAVAAGSFFVFTGKHRAVLITYPPRESLRKVFEK